MSTYKMQSQYESFPEMEGIYRALTNSEHIVRSLKENGHLYSAIHLNRDNFVAYYKDIGFDLIHDDEGLFYYLDKLDSNFKASSGANTRNVTIFVMALFSEVDSDTFKDGNIYTKVFDISTLPHFKNKTLHDKMVSAGIRERDLSDILTRMHKIRLISFTEDKDGFTFNTPVLRFLRSFNKLADLSDDQHQIESESMLKGDKNE